MCSVSREIFLFSQRCPVPKVKMKTFSLLCLDSSQGPTPHKNRWAGIFHNFWVIPQLQASVLDLTFRQRSVFRARTEERKRRWKKRRWKKRRWRSFIFFMESDDDLSRPKAWDKISFPQNGFFFKKRMRSSSVLKRKNDFRTVATS